MPLGRSGSKAVEWVVRLEKPRKISSSKGSTPPGASPAGRLPRSRSTRFTRAARPASCVTMTKLVPRERFNSQTRARIHRILAQAFDGRESAAMPVLELLALIARG